MTFPIPCKKKGFASKQLAYEELEFIRLNPSARRRETRAYRCHRCQQWHLTSQERRGPITKEVKFDLEHSPGHVARRASHAGR